MSRMELQDMDRPFNNSFQYLFNNYMAQVGPNAVCAYGAMLKLIERGNLMPTYEEVAEAAGCKESTLRRAFDLLASYGIITKISRVDKRGSQLSNLYKLNDPDNWLPTNDTPLVNFTNPLVDFTTPFVNFTTGLEEPSTGVSDAETPPLVNFTNPLVNFTALSSSSSSSLFTDLTTDQKEQDRADLPTSTLTNSGTGEGSRDPNARDPIAPKPVPTMDDGPFAKACKLWHRNVGKLNEPTERTLWGFYEKYGGEMLLEGLNTALTENTRGDKPSMRFLEAILQRLDNTKRADEIRRKELEYRANPQSRPENEIDYFGTAENPIAKALKLAKERKTDPKENGNG